MKLKNRTMLRSLGGVAAAVLVAAGPAQAQQYPSTVLAQGPVGYWRLNETTVPGTPLPAQNLGSLGSAANGTYNGLPVTGLAGPFAGSLAIGLDGAAAFVDTPYQAGLNTVPFSVELWLNPAVVPNTTVVSYMASSVQTASPRSGWYLAQDNGTTFGVGSAFVVRLFNQNGTTPTAQLAVPVSTTGWYHIVLTHDGTTASLYSNGVLVTNVTAGYVPNAGANANGPALPFTVGVRSNGQLYWAGQAAEVAMYSTALTAAQVASHYSTAMNNPSAYEAGVLANSPLLYWRFREANNPVAVNVGSLGSAGNGFYVYDAVPGVAGPQSPTFPGFEANNTGVKLDAVSGYVRLPALELNTNTITMTCWILPNGSQLENAGIAIADGGQTPGTGLAIDEAGGYQMAYHWDGNGLANNVPSGCYLSPTANEWSFVALSVTSSNALLAVANADYGWQTFVNTQFNPPVQAFDVPLALGADLGAATGQQFLFNGAIDEFAIFNRSLSQGELYTEYCAAIGSQPPQIFTDLQGPSGPVSEGDPFTLFLDVGGSPPLTYVWYDNGTYVTTTSAGALSFASSTLAQSGTYSCTITNLYGAAYSQPWSVSVTPPSPPSIIATNGLIARTLYPGGTWNLSVVAVGGGLKYQWYKNGGPISAATQSAFTIASVTNTDAGAYIVAVTNVLGAATAGTGHLTVATVSSNSYEAIIVAAKPEAWWRLDEPVGSTNMWDAMGRHDGYYTSLVAAVPPVTLGVPGALANDPDTAVGFTPSKEGVGVAPYTPAFNSFEWSVEGWVNTPTANEDVVAFSSSFGNNGWWWETIGGYWNPNSAQGYWNIQEYGIPCAISPGQWTHLVITYNPTTVISGTSYPWLFYVNGQTGPYVFGFTTPNNAGPFIIGAQGVSATTLAEGFFNGSVDEVAFYERVLSGTEIAAHFQGRFGASTPPYFVGSFLPQTTVPGKNITWTTEVYGSIPINVQWYWNSSPIVGATTTTLSLTNVAVTSSGTYTLWATNSAGTASQSVVLTVIPPVPYDNDTNNLVLHLTFDGNTLDSSGRGNNGTPSSAPEPAPIYVPGLMWNFALAYTNIIFTNSSGTLIVTNASYVDLGAPPDLQWAAGVSFTISLWVKTAPGDLQGDLPYIGNATNSNNNLGWDLSPSYKTGDWQFCLNDGTHNFDASGPGNSINDGNWHNFVVTVDRTANAANAYLDSVLEASLGISGLGALNPAGPITIGQDPTHQYPEPGGATLGDIGIWRRVLSPLEVAKLCSAGLSSHSFNQPAPPVTLTLTKTGTSITLGWSVGTLLASPVLGPAAVWVPVPGASAPSYTFTPGAGNMYYRVQTQ